MTENRNYYALLHCILQNSKPERSLSKFGISSYSDERKSSKTRKGITIEDVIGMFELKEEGWTYQQIGEYFGKSEGAIYHIMKRNEKYINPGGAK